MKVFSQKRPLLFSLSVMLSAVTVMIVLSALFVKIFDISERSTAAAVSLASELMLSLLIILIARKIGISKGWFSAAGIVKGLLLGWLGIVYSAVIFILILITAPPEYFAAPKPWPLLSAVCTAFAVGLFEEVLMRGIVLNTLLNKKGAERKDVLKACWISSALFGAMHLANILAQAGFIETIGQVIYAAFMGMYFAAVYIRSKSLWAPIILHAAFDLPQFIMSAMLSEQGLSAEMELQAAQSTSEAISSAAGSAAMILPFLIAALILLRKGKINGREENTYGLQTYREISPDRDGQA